MKKLSILVLLAAALAACSSPESPQAVASAAPPAAQPVVESAPTPAPPPMVVADAAPAPKRAVKPRPVAPPKKEEVPATSAETRTPTYGERVFPELPPPPPFVEARDAAPAPPVVKAPQIRQITIPAGTNLFVRMIDTID